MKNWVQNYYPADHMSYDRLWRIVREAWNAIEQDQLQQLILQMQESCQTVIDANGKDTRF